MPTKQSLINQLGEVVFRRKLVKQHLGHNSFFTGAPNSHQIVSILAQRIQDSRRVFTQLSKANVLNTPFLEIGAEKCQRSLLLVNEYKLPGFALDISYDSLASSSYFRRRFNYSRLPIRICADAYHLPFATHSLPFVFCFETLHHFPHPLPILQEIKRVLSPLGHFYFSEEPVSQIFNLHLWRRDYNLTYLEQILKLFGLLPFLSTLGKVETSHNVLENTFSLATWFESLSIFSDSAVSLRPIFFGPGQSFYLSSPTPFINPLTYFLLALQGGGITALCKKSFSSTPPTASPKKLTDLLRCPSCPKQPQLKNLGTFLKCLRCQVCYPIKNGVYFLLPITKLKALYANI